MSIGQRISELRSQNNISQNQLAKALEVSRQAVSKWENDQTAPDTLNLIKLADLLNTDVEYLATGRHRDTPTVITIEKPVEVEKIVEIEKVVQVEKVVTVDKYHETVVEKPVVRKITRTKFVRNPIEYAIIFIAGFILGLIIGMIL